MVAAHDTEPALRAADSPRSTETRDEIKFRLYAAAGTAYDRERPQLVRLAIYELANRVHAGALTFEAATEQAKTILCPNPTPLLTSLPNSPSSSSPMMAASATS